MVQILIRTYKKYNRYFLWPKRFTLPVDKQIEITFLHKKWRHMRCQWQITNNSPIKNVAYRKLSRIF